MQTVSGAVLVERWFLKDFVLVTNTPKFHWRGYEFISKRNGICIINIINKGYKLNEEEINNLFTPFYRSKRVKNNTPGFGLGLTICKKIIEAHAGKLILTTNGNEIQFSIEIPTGES